MEKQYMKILSFLFCAAIATSFLVAQTSDNHPQSRQGEKKVMQFKAGSVVFLQEIGAIVTTENGLIKVATVPPKDRRPSGMPDVDIAAADEVGMIAGKRITSIAELKKAYESIRAGEMVKLGLRRDGQLHIVAFQKKDLKDMPQDGRVIIRHEGAPQGGNSDFFPALGIGIQKRGAAIVVSETMPHAPKGMQKDDAIVSLNGKKIRSIADFNSAFDATAIGASLRFELLRNGQALQIAAPRPKSVKVIRRQQ
jgi:S1-C subfamily serine protease